MPGTRSGDKNSSVDILDENEQVKTRCWYDEHIYEALLKVEVKPY